MASALGMGTQVSCQPRCCFRGRLVWAEGTLEVQIHPPGMLNLEGFDMESNIDQCKNACNYKGGYVTEMWPLSNYFGHWYMLVKTFLFMVRCNWQL